MNSITLGNKASEKEEEEKERIRREMRKRMYIPFSCFRTLVPGMGMEPGASSSSIS